MKTFVRITGLFPLIIAIFAFYLMLTSPAVTYMPKSAWEQGSIAYLDSQNVIFGGLGVGPTFAGLTAFLLFILTFVFLIAGIILPLTKLNNSYKLSSLCNFVALVFLFLTAILVFNITPSYIQTAGEKSFCADNLQSGYYTIGIYWALAGLLSFVASLLTLIPSLFNLIIK